MLRAFPPFTPRGRPMAAVQAILEAYSKVVRALVMALAVLAALAVAAMMLVTCVDVIMRMCGTALRGSQDLVCVAGVLAAACALPYTTAVKGHVAVEFFFHKLERGGRIAVDTLMRLVGMGLFGAFAWCCYRQAHRSHLPGTPLLQGHPWGLYALALCCFAALALFLPRLRRGTDGPGRGRRLLRGLVPLTLLVVLLAWRLGAHVARVLRAPSRTVPLEVYGTLPIPKASMLYVLSFCCAVVVLVILHNLLHPGREMIKP